MKWILIILIILVCLFIGIPLLAALAYLFYTSFMLITGKITKQQLAEMVAKSNAETAAQKAKKKKIKRSFGSINWLSYPHPLNKRGL